MFCGNCGMQVMDGFSICPNCGAVVGNTPDVQQMNYMDNAQYTPVQDAHMYNLQYSSMQAGMMNSQGAPVEKEKKPKNAKKPKKNKSKLPIIILVVIALIGGGVAAYFMLFAKKDKEIPFDERFMSAYADKDMEKLEALMFPEDFLDKGEKKLEKCDYQILDTLEDACYECELTKFSFKEKQELDKLVEKKVVDKLLKPLKLDYEELGLGVYEIEVDEDEYDSAFRNIITYKYEDHWYMLPFLKECIGNELLMDDANTGVDLGEKLEEAISNDYLWDIANQYAGNKLTKDDIDYLPEELATVIKNTWTDDYAIQCTTNGSVGYSIVMNNNETVKVYVATDTYDMAWQVYPQPESYDDYLTGTIANAAATEGENKNLEFVRLISNQSVILGSWNADDASMVIGYNASGGDEGFTIYLLTQETGFILINPCAKSYFTGSYGKIVCTPEDKFYGNSSMPLPGIISFEVTSENNITMTFEQSHNLNSHIYQFTKGEITKDMLNAYMCDWYTYDEDREREIKKINFDWYEDIGTISEASWYDNYFKNKKVISLLDGKKLLNIQPREGLIFEDGEAYINVSYYMEQLTMEENQITYDTGLVGSGGYVCTLYNDDSEIGKKYHVIMEYSKYLKENYDWSGYESKNSTYCVPVYVDEDEIPELLFRTENDAEEYTMLLLSYYNNEVCSSDIGWNFWYAESKNSLFFEPIEDEDYGGVYGHLENGKIVEDVKVSHLMNGVIDDEEEYYYEINGEKCLEDEYEEYCEDNIKFYNEFIEEDYYNTLQDSFEEFEE